VDEAKTLLLRETGIARLSDGSEAVNVGPIVLALGFLTEGRGDDRGVDEHGAPLPDLLSLAFDVVQSIILGGRSAEYFRQVKLDFDAQSGLDGRASLALAKQAAVVRRSTPSTALERAANELRARLQQLDEVELAEERRDELKLALQAFRDFGADRWVAATSHLLLALQALDDSAQRSAERAKPKRKRAATPPPKKPKTPRKARAVSSRKAPTKVKAKPPARNTKRAQPKKAKRR
jgi:hypothetical protein